MFTPPGGLVLLCAINAKRSKAFIFYYKKVIVPALITPKEFGRVKNTRPAWRQWCILRGTYFGLEWYFLREFSAKVFFYLFF